jgi:hypothetical protein
VSGDWGKVECPRCGAAQPPPDPRAATNDDELIFVHLTCVNCGQQFDHWVQLWLYYGVAERLPSREEDR